MADAKTASVALIVAGSALDLSGLSRDLKLQPTHTHRAGSTNMIGQPFPHDMWQLETPLSEADPPDAHLKWLAAQLKPHIVYLRSLKSVADVYVYCGLNCDAAQCGFSLSPEGLALLTTIGIGLE